MDSTKNIFNFLVYKNNQNSIESLCSNIEHIKINDNINNEENYIEENIEDSNFILDKTD